MSTTIPTFAVRRPREWSVPIGPPALDAWGWVTVYAKRSV